MSESEPISEPGRYPLIIRNRAPLQLRAFTGTFLAVSLLVAVLTIRQAPTAAGKWWPYIIALSVGVGVWVFVWSLNREAAVIRITGPKTIHIRRGKAFRRFEERTDRADLRIEAGEGTEGPYFELWMAAPGGPLIVAEGQQRAAIEAIKSRIEAAVEGSETGTGE
jgi:hypothetical protein